MYVWNISHKDPKILILKCQFFPNYTNKKEFFAILYFTGKVIFFILYLIFKYKFDLNYKMIFKTFNLKRYITGQHFTKVKKIIKYI